MRKWAYLLFSLISALVTFCQKPVIAIGTGGSWPHVFGGSITSDGQYVSYSIWPDTIGSNQGALVIRSMKSGSEFKIENKKIVSSSFTADSKTSYFIGAGDTLKELTLGSFKVSCFPPVKSYVLSKNGKTQWLAYLTKSDPAILLLRNLKSNEQQHVPNVSNYFFWGILNRLIVQGKIFDGRETKQVLVLKDIEANKVDTFWSGSSVENVIENSNFPIKQQLAFITRDTTKGMSALSIWIFVQGMEKAVKVLSSDTVRLPSGYVLADLAISGFSKEGNCLFIRITGKKDASRMESDFSAVNIWSYADIKSPGLQRREAEQIEQPGVINISQGRLCFLGTSDMRFVSLQYYEHNNSDYILILKNGGDATESQWNENAITSASILKVASGFVFDMPVDNGGKGVQDYKLSPTGKYVIYYDVIRASYFSYEIKSGISREMTKGLNVRWVSRHDEDFPSGSRNSVGIGGWLKNDKAVLIYDQYDIWQVDPTGSERPVNLTNEYGKLHDISFRLLSQNRDGTVIDETIILTAFNNSTKENGFYQLSRSQHRDPVLLSMNSCLYTTDEYRYPVVKAVETNAYICFRSTAAESPNLFYTRDLRAFMPVSHLYPERTYNWLSAALISWKTFDGNTCQGILYKPESFDEHKKYPIIFYYYERLSDGLYHFIEPSASEGPLNIPYFVSNGYLVFTPDIHYSIGNTGSSVYNCVVSAARYLSKLPWIDSSAMGIQGHSFGGFETNYLITHTDMFAAACECAGVSDCVSDYGLLSHGDKSRQHFYENGQIRMERTLWESPSSYLENSPVLFVNRVNTPLLMMHNRGDMQVPFSQGLEFFNDLRRLRKPVWLLEYPGQGHQLTGSAAKDFSARMFDFFEYFLKHRPAADWMHR
jgi:dienelactone hydrolase